MSVLYLVVPLALLVVGAAVWAYVWASTRGQFDDLDTPAIRMLRDDGEIVQRDVDNAGKTTHDHPRS